MKRLCIFCAKDHRGHKPKLCKAKGEIMQAYLKEGLPMWKFLYAISNRMIDLDGEATRLLASRTLGQTRKRRTA